jgi:DeoR family suf operon transcriptional repressor
MQKTRQGILDYLKEHGEATVDELSEALGDLTPVTVRHHLDVMRSEGLIAAPVVQRRAAPGRPRHAYRLTERALELFPKNYRTLTDHMLAELKTSFSEAQVNAILDGVVERMATAAPSSREGEPLERRLTRTADYLTGQGYVAHWEKQGEGFILYVTNCPYYRVAEMHDEICAMDYRLISRLLGAPPRRIAALTGGDRHCAYVIGAGTI